MVYSKQSNSPSTTWPIRTGDFAASRSKLTDELSTLVEHLTTHLDLEERTALPLFASEMSADEYRGLEAKGRKATPRKQATFLIPWIVEHGSPDQRKSLFRSAPPLRVVYLLNRSRYRHMAEALLPAG